MKNGIIITFEGPDGAGKTTVLEKVLPVLQEKDYDIVTTREPGGVEIAERIRDVILDVKHVAMDSKTELLLYMAARRQHYVEKVLKRFGFSECKPSLTPYDPSVTLRKNKRIGLDQLRYSQIVGSLMYLAGATRSDISFAVSKLSRFM